MEGGHQKTIKASITAIKDANGEGTYTSYVKSRRKGRDLSDLLSRERGEKEIVRLLVDNQPLGRALDIDLGGES